MAFAMVARNNEMKEFYNYLKARNENPLKKKQALVVVSKKIISVIYYLIKNKEEYKAELVFNNYRKNQMMKAA